MADVLTHTAAYWIKRLGLQPHPEGGHFREVYRSQEKLPRRVLPERYGGERSFSTSIYFMIGAGEVSAWHRLKSDEIWHFYDGVPVVIYTINQAGILRQDLLGFNGEGGGAFQIVVEAGVWMSSILTDGEGYALMGCTVAPGFDFTDFELADVEALKRRYPAYTQVFDLFKKSTLGNGN